MNLASSGAKSFVESHTLRQSFQDDGYIIVRDVLTIREVEATRIELDDLIRRRCEGGDGRDAVRPERLTEPHVEEDGDFWLRLCLHPKVLDAAESALGPDLLLIMSHLIVKRPEDGLAVDWHQDNTYWESIEGTDVITVWLAIDDVDEENACMCVIPRSHDGYKHMEMVETQGTLLDRKVEVTAEMEASSVPMILKGGDLSIHDSFILHNSKANTSSRRRAGYTMRYANARSTRVDVKNHWVPVYLARGDCDNWRGRYRDGRPDRSTP